MTIKTLPHGVLLQADWAHLSLEVQEGNSYHDEDCLHLYFDGRATVKVEPGHIVLRLKRHLQESTNDEPENPDTKV